MIVCLWRREAKTGKQMMKYVHRIYDKATKICKWFKLSQIWTRVPTWIGLTNVQISCSKAKLSAAKQLGRKFSKLKNRPKILILRELNCSHSDLIDKMMRPIFIRTRTIQIWKISSNLINSMINKINKKIQIIFKGLPAIRIIKQLKVIKMNYFNRQIYIDKLLKLPINLNKIT